MGKIYQLKISLRKVSKPNVWRRVLVPSDISFAEFHKVIQIAMGWTNTHLYSFSDSLRYTSVVIEEPSEDDLNFGSKAFDANKLKLHEYFYDGSQPKIVYEYDFGNGWEHDILLEKIIEEGESGDIFKCVAGRGACPPEDCGGPWGYERLKEVMANEPNGEEAQMFSDWLGLESASEFDPKELDLDIINSWLVHE